MLPNEGEIYPSKIPNYSISWKEIGYVVLILSAILCLFFGKAIFQGGLIYSGDCSGSDLLELNIPRRILVAEAVRNGEVPLWEPNIGNGMPLLAEGQSGVFYPTTLPFYLALGPVLATNLSLLTTLLVALLGSYILARTYGVSPWAALLGSLSYGLGGAFIFRLKHLNMVQSIAWLPLSIAFIRLYLRKSDFRYLLALSLVWAMQFFAGHPHATYICWLSCYIYSIAQFFDRAEEEWRTKAKRVGRLLVAMLLAMAMALALSAVQLWPTWELIPDSVRSQSISWDDLRSYPFKLSHLERLVYPYIDGNPAIGTYTADIAGEGVFWESTPYLGIVPLVLALSAPWISRKRSTLVIVSLALTFGWLALGPAGGLFWLPWKLCPAFDLFRFPARLLIPSACFGALLVSLGAQAIFERMRSQKFKWIFASVAFILTLSDLFWINLEYQAYLPSDCLARPASCSLIEGEKQRVYAPTYFLSWSRLNSKGGWKNNIPALIHHLKCLNPDIAAIWGTRCHSDRVVLEGGMELAGYFTLQVWQYKQVLSYLDKFSGGFRLPEEVVCWLRLQNVSHITSFLPWIGADKDYWVLNTRAIHDQRFSDMPLYVYTLREPSPLVRLVPTVLTERVPDCLVDVIANLPHSIGGGLYEPDMINPISIGSAQIVAQGRNFLNIETECSEEAYLIVANNYHPNWKAYLDDGTPITVERVNCSYQAVKVPAGFHRIVLKYRSSAFIGGAIISSLALVILIAICVFLTRRSFSKH